jgi:hypothetical protein
VQLHALRRLVLAELFLLVVLLALIMLLRALIAAPDTGTDGNGMLQVSVISFIAFFSMLALGLAIGVPYRRRVATRRPLPPPGWYTDPGDSTRNRWWDGLRWQAATRPLGQQRPGPN